MILIDECKLQNQTIELIGLNYQMKQEKGESYKDFLDRIVERFEYGNTKTYN